MFPLLFAAVFASTTAVVGADLVGRIAGTIRLTDVGSAQYEIPIATPPGTAGMMPHVSILFDSSNLASNSLGRSFSLNAASHIARCPQDMTRDGVTLGVRFTASDRFCLDGQRLVLANGTVATYGADGAEYRTEIDNFARVIQRGVVAGGAGALSFEIWTRSGERLLYGSTKDSRATATNSPTGLVRTWYLHHRRDPAGNYINYTYVDDVPSGVRMLRRIDYTGNVAAGLEPYNSVEFAYRERPDVNTAFTEGASMTMHVLLDNITTAVDGVAVDVYRFGFERDCLSGVSRLSNVTRCAGVDLRECLPPTQFEWAENCTGTNVFRAELGAATPTTSILSFASLEVQRHKIGDFNGDGLADLLYVGGGLGAPGSQLFINGGGAFGMPTPADAIMRARNKLQFAAIDIARVSIVDLNGDGRQDVFVNRGGWDESDEDVVFLANADGSFPSAPTSTNLHTPIGTTVANASLNLARLQFCDIDGDALVDAMYIDARLGQGAPIKFYRNLNGSSFATQSLYGPNVTLGVSLAMAGIDLGAIRCVDMDGDGLSDVYVFGVGVFINRGASFALAPNYKGPPTAVSRASIELAHLDLQRIRLTDLNGDGQTDVYVVNGGLTNQVNDTMYVMHGDGSFDTLAGPATTPTASGATLARQEYSRLHVHDMNSDGYADVYRVEGKSTTPTADRIWISFGDGAKFLERDGAKTMVRGVEPLASLDIASIRFGDYTGDGAVDVYQARTFNTTAQHDALYRSIVLSPELASIIDGFGSVTTIHYTTLARAGAFYAKGRDAVFPERDVKSTTIIVANLTQSDGSGGNRTTVCSYGGFRMHMQGLGSLGYAWAAQLDLETRASSNHTYSQDWKQFTHHQLMSTTRHVNGQLLEQTSASFAVDVAVRFGDDRAVRRRVWSPTERIERFMIGTSGAAYRLSTTATNSTFDLFNNLVEQVVRTDDLVSGITSVGRTLTVFENRLDRGLWQIGLMRNVTSIDQVGAGEAQIATGLFEFDPMQPFVVRETMHADSITPVIVAYTRNGFGQVLSKTMSAVGEKDRTERAEYDARGRFVVRSINALGHTSAASFDSKRGSLLCPPATTGAPQRARAQSRLHRGRLSRARVLRAGPSVAVARVRTAAHVRRTRRCAATGPTRTGARAPSRRRALRRQAREHLCVGRRHRQAGRL
jgi:hypothetical protein